MENRSTELRIENPFSLKVGQVFTGFGIGCGIGIGVGRPIYLGSIPMMQQVMSATRGATDVFSSAGNHVNSTLRKVGMKNIQAGVGCGVGVGHGFGVGLAMKPGVVNRIQSSVLEATTKLVLKLGLAPSLSSMQSVIPGQFQSSINALTSTAPATVMPSILTSKNRGNSLDFSKSNQSYDKGSTQIVSDLKGTTDASHGTHTEKVLNNFLQNPIFKQEEENELSKLAENLRLENNVLQVLLRQQQAIQGLVEENLKLQRILVDDLKVHPAKLKSNNYSFTHSSGPCSDCFECRRRSRRSRR